MRRGFPGAEVQIERQWRFLSDGGAPSTSHAEVLHEDIQVRSHA